MLEFYLLVVAAIVTANVISVVLATLAMSNGGIMKWLGKRYEKMFETWEKEL